MPDEPSQSIPDVSQPAHDQRAATAAEPLPAQDLAPMTEVLRGRDLTASLAGMAAESENLTLNRISVIAINSAVGMFERSRDQAVAELREERNRSADLQERLKSAEIRVANLQGSRAADRASSGLRLVVNALGSVVLGFTFYAYDKWGISVALGTGLFGAALVVAPWLFRPRSE
jgi:hypothetical protein